MNGVLAFLKPFAWLAAIAFVSGFLGYLVIGHPSRAIAQDQLQAAVAASGPAGDEWNLPKHI